MLRGSRPGERRGGRQRNTPNRRTVLVDRILSIGSEHPTASWRALLLKLVKDPKLPADTRIAVTHRCFPAKQTQSRRPGQSPELDSPLNTTRQDIPDKAASAKVLEAVSVQTLDTLFGVVQDAAADPKARRKAALKIAESLLPKAEKKAKALPDEYGFVVNPDIARKYRDLRRELRSFERSRSRKIPAVAEKIRKLRAQTNAILGRFQVPCPSIYGVNQNKQDWFRLIELLELQADGSPLTEAQDAEEAHLRVRCEAYRYSPQEIARQRCKELEDAEQRFKCSVFLRQFRAPRLSRKDQRDLKLLRWLCPRPQRDLSQLELDELIRSHPFHNETPAWDGNFYRFQEFLDE
jgi:hypothetical protein